MTRFARGGDANKKKPLEASSWKELKGRSLQKTDEESFTSRPPSKTPGSESMKNCTSKSSEKKSDKLRGIKDKIKKTNPKKKILIDTETLSHTESKMERRIGVKYIKKLREREKRRLKRKQSRDQHKVCFNCREPGHQVADCPRVRKDPEQGTGICFKCGSTEHMSSRCHVKLPPGEYPYAKCFICGEMGHLTKQCPDNPRGLYPKGGCCKHCGSVEHFRRDCPELQKEQGIQDIKLDTINSKESADAEDDSIDKYIPVKKKKAKVVKF